MLPPSMWATCMSEVKQLFNGRVLITVRSFYTTEEQIHELFAKYELPQFNLAHNLMICRCGEIKRLVMGLDRFNKTPCGFCFVEYYNHQDALDCMKYIGGTKLDERIIRTDLDPGFQEGRQYGCVVRSAQPCQ